MVAIDIHPIATIAAKELRDAKRHRWFVLFATLFAGLAIVLSLAGFWGMGVTGFAGFSRTAASLSNLVALIVPLMGLMLGSMSITNEREKGTLEILLAQPISLSEVLLGKWFGLSAALTAAVLLGFGLSRLVIASSTTTEQIGAYLHLLVFTLLLGYANLSVGVLISTLSAKNSTSVSIALTFWLVVVLLSDLGLMGTAIVLKLKPQTLLWLAMLNPVQVFRVSVLKALQGNLELLGPAGTYAMDVFGQRLSFLLAIWLIVWALVPLVLTLLLFRQQREGVAM